jgi:ABC-type Fe3+ transport system permease subunit
LPIAAFQQAFSGDIGIAAAYSSIMILVTALALLMLVRQDGVDAVMR